MAVGHSKSTPITNSDSTPRIANTSGKGAPGRLKNVSAFVTAPATANGDIDTTIQMVRVPSTAIVKRVAFSGASQGSAGKVDIGVYKATGGDGPLGAASSLLASAALDQDFFAAAIDLGGAASQLVIQPGAGVGYDGVATAILATAPAWARNDINKELWDALGLTVDPKGFFDICLTVTEALQTGSADVALSVDYV